MSQGGLGAWYPKFLRSFNDWKMDAIQAFTGLTRHIVITPVVKDKLIWKGDEYGCFMVKAYFNHLEGASPYSVPTKMQRNLYVPSKIGFFLPRNLGGGKVLTSTQLKKRGFHLASKCPFCGRKKEELEHILIHCPSIWGQWIDFLSAFGASWAYPLLVKYLLQG